MSLTTTMDIGHPVTEINILKIKLNILFPEIASSVRLSDLSPELSLSPSSSSSLGSNSESSDPKIRDEEPVLAKNKTDPGLCT